MTKEKIAEIKRKSELNLSDFEYLDDGSFNELNGEINMAQEAVLIINELLAENAELKAENEKLKNAMQWRNIETAPKDGTDILVFNKLSKEQFAVFWDNGAWVFATDRNKCQIITNAHYWMPLPKPPKIEE